MNTSDLDNSVPVDNVIIGSWDPQAENEHGTDAGFYSTATPMGETRGAFDGDMGPGALDMLSDIDHPTIADDSARR
ncbi:hypothetical protein QP162_20535 [Sphingomonas aurantiaca]|uniref:hypothetical protein n=1 Tax=Sphingomonas aurantiaca TaxID=185949 RepID=UPI002FE25869